MGEQIVLGANTIYDINDKFGMNSHVCVFGDSGSGKTHSIVKPNILSFSDAGSSMIISDPKGTLEKEFKNYLKKIGYKVYSIDLINPEKSNCTFNPICGISSEIEIIKLAHRIIYSSSLTRNSTHQDPYWNRQAEILLSMLIELVLIVEEDGKETFDRVIHYATNITSDGTGLTNRIMDSFVLKEKECLATKQWLKMRGLMSAEKTFACVVSSVQEHLGRYECDEMKNFFNKKNRICFEKFAIEKSVLFLKISDSDDTYYDFANLIYSYAIDAISSYADGCLGGRAKVPVRFILDDFATNVLIEGMPRMISVARARNISFMLVCQSVQQLRRGYKEDAQTIIANCHNIIFLGTNDVETAQEFSTRLNQPVYDILTLDRNRIFIFRTGEKSLEDVRYDYRKHSSYKLLSNKKIR